MTWRKPSPADVWRAIDIYLSLAYDGPPPPAVSGRVRTLRSSPAGTLFDSPVWERDPAAPTRLRLRLGNRHYPHMKLVIEGNPDGEGCLFRADTHDQHCCPPPGSREHEGFRELMAANQAIALAIEAKWADGGLPTFKTYLRDDLRRRHSAG